MFRLGLSHLKHTARIAHGSLGRIAMRSVATASDLTFDQYPFLKELGLSKLNHGVYYGDQWIATGQHVFSMNPATGKPIAAVIEVRTHAMVTGILSHGILI